MHTYDPLFHMSTDDLVREGFLVIERRPFSTTYRPTNKYRAAMGMSVVPCVYETSRGTFYTEGKSVKLLGTGKQEIIDILPEYVEDAIDAIIDPSIDVTFE